MTSAPNTPVMIGPVPLLYVQSMSVSEGYRIERIASSSFSQALSPTTKTITIEAVLPGPKRLAVKKSLEALALVSRVMVAAAAPLIGTTGIPVVSGLTVSLDMQITDLRFSQTVGKRDALDVSVTLQHVPRSSAVAVLGEVADLALAGGVAVASSPPEPAAVPRTPVPVPDPGPRFPMGALRIPVDADAGFPQAFRMTVGTQLYSVTLGVTVQDDAVLAAGLPLELPSPVAYMVAAVTREGAGGPETILRRKIVRDHPYQAAELELTFSEITVDPRNIRAAGAFGSRVEGQVTTRWAS